MSGWTMKPRKPGGGCEGCGEPRGAVLQALMARPSAGRTLWLCTGCARIAARRQEFVDDYARRCGLPPDEWASDDTRPQPAPPRRRRDEL